MSIQGIENAVLLIWALGIIVRSSQNKHPDHDFLLRVYTYQRHTIYSETIIGLITAIRSLSSVTNSGHLQKFHVTFKISYSFL